MIWIWIAIFFSKVYFFSRIEISFTIYNNDNIITVKLNSFNQKKISKRFLLFFNFVYSSYPDFTFLSLERRTRESLPLIVDDHFLDSKHAGNAWILGYSRAASGIHGWGLDGWLGTFGPAIPPRPVNCRWHGRNMREEKSCWAILASLITSVRSSGRGRTTYRVEYTDDREAVNLIFDDPCIVLFLFRSVNTTF